MLTGHKIVDQISKINFSGNIYPRAWRKTITKANGKPYPLARDLLSEFIYWYRWTENINENTKEVTYKKKFSGDLLYKSYRELTEDFGESAKVIRTALDRLEELGAIKRHYRVVKYKNGEKKNNKMYIELIPERIIELTFPENVEVEDREDYEPGCSPADVVYFEEVLEDGTVVKGSLNQEMDANGPQSLQNGDWTEGMSQNVNRVFNPVAENGNRVVDNSTPMDEKGNTLVPNWTEPMDEKGNTLLPERSQLTKNTTEITTKSSASYPIVSNNNNISVCSQVDEMGLDENRPHNPEIIRVDITQIMDEIEYWNIQGWLKQREKIPYSLATYPERMKIVLQYLCGWDLVAGSKNPSEYDYTFKLIFENLLHMCLAVEPMEISSGKVRITYNKVLDLLNIPFQRLKTGDESPLSKFMDRCVRRYNEVNSKTGVKIPDAYAKTVIWSMLGTFEGDWNGWFERSENEAREKGLYGKVSAKEDDPYEGLEQKLIMQNLKRGV